MGGDRRFPVTETLSIHRYFTAFFCIFLTNWTPQVRTYNVHISLAKSQSTLYIPLDTFLIELFYRLQEPRHRIRMDIAELQHAQTLWRRLFVYSKFEKQC